MDFWDWFWLMVWWFCFFAYLILLFQIIADLFRDPSVGGWAKAFWVVGLIVLPFLVALIYIVARGKGMAQRQLKEAVENKAAADEYIRATAGTTRSAASEIADAKALLDAGAISPDEFAVLKSRALAA